MPVVCPKCKTQFVNGVGWCSRCGQALPKPTADAVAEQDRSGVVYLIRCGAYYKIGKTTNPNQRYDQLRIQLPEKPELVHEIETTDVDYTERHWHKRFANSRANGEWFSLTKDEVLEFLRCAKIVVARS